MKRIFYIAVIAAVAFTSCEENDTEKEGQTGSFIVEFDNMAGTTPVSLVEAGSAEYSLTSQSTTKFNLTAFKYYVSKIKLSGSNGELFEDEMNVSASADEVKGYYMVDQSEPSSFEIELKNVPEGTYNSITFTIGVEEDGVQEGAAGGILDPAAGAPFWSWNAGYIGMQIEGAAETSGQVEVLSDGVVTTYEKSISYHIGGWKDIVPEDGSDQRFFNNVKTITLSLYDDIKVGPTYEPQAHIVTDVVKILGDVDFATNFGFHSPAAGRTFADNLTTAFTVDHVHQ